MKKIVSLVFGSVMLFSAALSAQKPVLAFDTETHDFGDIKEADGPVTFVFNYKNSGATPLVLHNVQASCGCTTPEWTRTPVQPNGTGTIKVTFNPANRPGRFNKTITIQSNAQTPVKTLRIAGNVLQRPKTLEDTYPVLMDGLRLSDNHLPFTKMSPEEHKMAEIQVINVSDKPLTPEFINTPEHLKILVTPATIAPGEKGVIQANYDASKKNDWGFVTDQIYMIFDGQRRYSNRITVSATISEDFSKFSEAELAAAPVIEFDNKVFDFGTVAQTASVEHEYVVTNKGESNLIIRKVKPSCGCTAVAPAKTVLAKGESTTIHIKFDPRGKTGRQQKTITVISNDPKQSNILLRIVGSVTAPNADFVK